ncbi:unnamed protein product [Knipowitschia caucasica]
MSQSPQIKEEPEEQRIKHEEEQLQVLVSVKTDECSDGAQGEDISSGSGGDMEHFSGSRLKQEIQESKEESEKSGQQEKEQLKV